MPRVTVAMPMYNAEPWVAEAVASVLAQTEPDLECLVVNDGSTDRGPAIAEWFAAHDARVRVVHQDNRGLAEARNRAIADSTAPHLLFLDADDWLAPTALRDLRQAAADSPSGCAAGWSEWRLAHAEPTGWTSDWLSGAIDLDDLLDRNRCPTHAILLSREAIGDDRFDPSLRAVEDYDMWLRLAARGVTWPIVERVVCAYRLRPSSMSHGFEVMAECTRAVLASAYARTRAAAPASIDASPAREGAVLRRHLLGLATAAAVADAADGAQRGSSLLRGDAARPPISPAEAAAAAHWMAPFALGLPPNAWTAPGAPLERMAGPLAAWWTRLESEGLGAPGLGADAPAMLPGAVTPPAHAAQAAADRLIAMGAGRDGAVLIGFGQNGRALARRLTARGVAVHACDDAWRTKPPTPGVSVGPIEPPTASPLAPIAVTPDDDAALWRRVEAWGRPAVRWSDVRRALAAGLAPRFARAFGPPTPRRAA